VCGDMTAGKRNRLSHNLERRAFLSFFRINPTLTPGMTREFRESFSYKSSFKGDSRVFWCKRNFNARDDKGVSREFLSYKSIFNARDDKGVSREFFFVQMQL